MSETRALWADKMRIRLARDLREIQSLYGDLAAEAYYRATGHDAGDLEAINLLGPAADLDIWQRRYELAEAAHLARVARGEATVWKSDYAADQVAELHPLLVLATWEDAIRDTLGTPTTARATVAKSAKYIASAVPWMLDDDQNGDINFIAVDALANDLSRCRTMLENVLKDGRRADTGAPCIECAEPLVKVWSEAKEYDTWKCHNSGCDESGEPVSPERYKNAVRAGYLANATSLTATDMLEAYRIKSGTLTGWTSKGLVHKRGKDDSGRILYDVAEAVAQRDKADQHADDEPRDAA